MESELGSLFRSATCEDMKARRPNSGLHILVAGHGKSIQTSNSPQIKAKGTIMVVLRSETEVADHDRLLRSYKA